MDMESYKQAFLDESLELVQSLNEILIMLEKDPQNKNHIEELFRAAHSLKGMAAAMGYSKIEELTHNMESSFDKIKNSKEKVTPALINAMFNSLDVLKGFLDELQQGKKAGKQKSDPAKDEIENNTGAKAKETSTLRVHSSHLDQLVDLTGELVIETARLEQTITPSTDNNQRFAFENLKGVLTELQQEIMQTRMVPAENIFNRFPRLVRDTANELGKKVELIIKGAEIELDKTILDEITQPLVHLIKNAVFHGLEEPDARKEQGKKPQGKIYLTARKEKDNMIIEVQDDGRGIDIKVLRDNIAKKGILSKKQLKTLSDSEVLECLCKPGFSSEKKATHIAGRGVGLDAVKEKVEYFGGSLEIQSEIGLGSTFRLRLPLTLAIIQALLVKVSNHILAIPLSSIAEVVSLDGKKINTIQGQKFLLLHEKIVPLIDLKGIFEISTNEKLNDSHGVIVELYDRQFGLIIDSTLGQKEIVVKPLAKILRGIKGIGGGAILGDGQVAIVLDIRSLIKDSDSLRIPAKKGAKNG